MSARRAIVVGAVVAALAPGRSSAAARLASADVRIAFESAVACTVEMTLELQDAPEVTQRIEVMDGASIDALEVAGAVVTSPPMDVGRTRVLVTRPDAGRYTLRYTARQPASHPGRCPLWVPTAAADGRSASVSLAVRVPAGARPGGTMPTFAWSGDEGTAAIGHLPALVRVPFAAPGEPMPWNIGRIMDIFSIAALVLATLAWVRRQTRSQDLETPRPPAGAKAAAGEQDLTPGRRRG